MSRFSALGGALVVVLLAFGHAAAMPFAIVGPRAVGMGDAGVTTINDAHAIHWNPSGVANRRGLDFAKDNAALGVGFGYRL